MDYYPPHTALDNPALTEEVAYKNYTVEDLISAQTGPKYIRKKAQITENILLNKWEYKSDWRRYLDKPLIVHAAAIKELEKTKKYDAAIGIKTAGTPYLELFDIMGIECFDIDYSIYRKKSEAPVIDEYAIEQLKEKKNVILVDIDIVTGKTLRDVTEYLHKKNIPVTGVYLGLSAWPGADKKSDEFGLGKETVNFSRFWSQRNSILTVSRHSAMLSQAGVLPKNFEIYTGCPCFEKQAGTLTETTNTVAKYIIDTYHEDNN